MLLVGCVATLKIMANLFVGVERGRQHFWRTATFFWQLETKVSAALIGT